MVVVVVEVAVMLEEAVEVVGGKWLDEAAGTLAVEAEAGVGSGFPDLGSAGWAVRSATSCWMSTDEESSGSCLLGSAPGSVGWTTGGMEAACASPG